jgi:hypothetical protein
VADKLVVAASTAANLSADDATPIDTGYRDLSVFDLGSVLAASTPITFNVLGEHVMDGAWGGIPLEGRRRTEMVVESSHENSLTVYEYDLGLPVTSARSEAVRISPGRQLVDLSAYHGIVSFKLGKADPQVRIQIRLNT